MATTQLYIDTTLGRPSHRLHRVPYPVTNPVEKHPPLAAVQSYDDGQDPFKSLSAMFTHNQNADFWWKTTGSVFAQMLQSAFYPLHQQYRYLVFFNLVILPEFGPAPSLGDSFSPLAHSNSLKSSHLCVVGQGGLLTPPSSNGSPTLDFSPTPESSVEFPSYMTDDHSPVELSWQFDGSGGAVVRFAIDPVKRQMEGDTRGAMSLFEDLSQMKVLARGVDLDWCRVCAETLTLSSVPPQCKATGTPEYPSQYFVGFDFSSKGIVMKAYFLPETRAAITSTSKTALVTSCIMALSTPTPSCPTPPDLLTPWRRTLSFFNSLPIDLVPTINIVAVDCVASGKNRVKIYARTPRATLANLRHFMTLGRDAAETSHTTQRALKQITMMWYLLFPQLASPEFDDVEAPATDPGHPTGGLLWYYELRPGHAEPFPKVYLPVRHWCRSDQQVVDAVETFYRNVGNHRASERYARDVRQTFNHRPLGLRAGIHTYITFAVKQEEVEVTSYFNPECYAPERR
ncbi:aromatic prenyltransferase [Ramaria rubella]|nr:aromatic prenyltransferase [Ramaria rubella]